MRRPRRWLALLTGALLGAALAIPTAVSPALAAAPTNDNIASAAVLSAASVSASNMDATTESGEPGPYLNSVAQPPSTTVWWKWVAPSGGTFLFDTCDSTFTTALGIYTATDPNSPTMATLTDRSTAEPSYCFYWDGDHMNQERFVTATAGVTYFIQVGAEGGGDQEGGMGTVKLRWSSVAPPNDNFSAAATSGYTLTAASGQVTGTTRLATVETGESTTFNSSPSVWWSFKPTAAGDYTFDTCRSDYDSEIAVYTGTAVDDLTRVGTKLFSCDGESVTFTADTATTYYVDVTGNDVNTIGDFTLAWHRDTIHPVNDVFDASLISNPTYTLTGASGTVSGSNRGATTDAAGPEYSVWWRWVAPNSIADNEKVEFDLCGDGTDFSPALSIYTGSTIGGLTAVTVEGASCGTQLSRFHPEAGTTYDIAVGTWSGGGHQGDYDLHWEIGAPPANDNFAAATPLSGAGGTAYGSTVFATMEEEGNLFGGHSIWWTWMSPATPVEVTFSTCGSAAQAVSMAVFSGSSPTDWTDGHTGDHNACGGLAKVTFTPQLANTAYHVVVGEYSGVVGPIALHWPASGTAGAPSVTTHPQNTTVMAGATATFTAAATGTPAPTVQWQEYPSGGSAWADISGATSTTYTFTAEYSMTGNQYRAVFTNLGGSVQSNAATLTVTAVGPTVTSSPLSQNATAGYNVSLSAAASGNPVPTVQWQLKPSGGSWADISGATATTYTFTAQIAMNANQYRAVFTNPGGTATSTAATLTVYPAPTGTSVTNLVATVSKGSITITFDKGGSPPFVLFLCQLNGAGAKGMIVDCSSGSATVKTSAKSVSVTAYYYTGGPGATTVSTDVVRAH